MLGVTVRNRLKHLAFDRADLSHPMGVFGTALRLIVAATIPGRALSGGSSSRCAGGVSETCVGERSTSGIIVEAT